MRDSELRALARLHGIQLSFEDATGKRREASVDTLRAIIKAREEAFARAQSRAREPVVVKWNAAVPPAFRYDEGEQLVIHAPRKAHPIDRKLWGLFVPLPAAGESLDDLRKWREAFGADIVATLPLLQPHGDERSPYSPSTRLKWNERYGTPDKSMPLYLDFPLGVHPEGEDVRKYRDSFVKGMSVGSPPDAFFKEGQNWGFPPLDPEAIRDNRYEYFRAAVAFHASAAHVLRLDHVMGLHRLYWIPEGAKARDGAYVRYHADELYAILTIESNKHRCAIVGEDLGTVPKEVPRAMQRHGIRRMFVVQYEPPGAKPPRECVASVNTHDMPTFATFNGGADIEKLEKTVLRLAQSDAELVLVNPEDLWGETEGINNPGEPERSWRHRFRLSLDEARKHPDVRRIIERVKGARLAK